MKPYVIYFNRDFISLLELCHDGKSIAKDTREAMRFATEEEAQSYIDRNWDNLLKIGSDPRPLFSVPVGYTHH